MFPETMATTRVKTPNACTAVQSSAVGSSEAIVWLTSAESRGFSRTGKMSVSHS